VKARNIRFHPEARAELRAAVEFYEQQAPGLGRDLVGEVRVVLIWKGLSRLWKN
jgi:hypothetical protein